MVFGGDVCIDGCFGLANELIDVDASLDRDAFWLVCFSVGVLVLLDPFVVLVVDEFRWDNALVNIGIGKILFILLFFVL